MVSFSLGINPKTPTTVLEIKIAQFLLYKDGNEVESL
jgi:hypothetical protein